MFLLLSSMVNSDVIVTIEFWFCSSMLGRMVCAPLCTLFKCIRSMRCYCFVVILEIGVIS